MKDMNVKPHSLILWLTLLFALSMPAFADPVILEWDANQETDLRGYYVYHGNASRTYGTPIYIEGNNPTHTFTDLPPGTWYFAVTAVNLDWLESGFSNEESTTISSGEADCDINDDGSTNVLDLQILINVILGIQTHPGDLDLNGDGTVNVLDLQLLGNVVLGVRSCP